VRAELGPLLPSRNLALKNSGGLSATALFSTVKGEMPERRNGCAGLGVRGGGGLKWANVRDDIFGNDGDDCAPGDSNDSLPKMLWLIELELDVEDREGRVLNGALCACPSTLKAEGAGKPRK
jgi:hypothetical protein